MMQKGTLSNLSLRDLQKEKDRVAKIIDRRKNEKVFINDDAQSYYKIICDVIDVKKRLKNCEKKF